MLGLAALGCEPATSVTVAPRSPNVVIVVMDTARGDRCSVNGYDRPTTPNLARVAAEGVVYRDAWSPAGWTGPAHASLFSGLRPPRHGFLGGNRLYLDDQATTLAEHLRAAGYNTASFTNNNFITPAYGLTQGFEHVVLAFANRELGELRAPWTHTNAAEWAVAKHHAGKPFFLFVNDMEPHVPYVPPEAIARRFLSTGLTAVDVSAGRAWGALDSIGYTFGLRPVRPSLLRAISDLYDGEIATLDAALPLLLQPLADAGALDDTIVVVASDHGESLGEHRLLDHKWSLHRAVLHVPLVIRYPPRIHPGQVVDDVVRLEDIMPTVLELAGLKVPVGLDGESLLGATAGRIARADFGTTLHYEKEMGTAFPHADLTRLGVSIRSVYDGRHHYIRYSDGGEELYDVVADPGESHDLALSGTVALPAMRELLERSP